MVYEFEGRSEKEAIDAAGGGTRPRARRLRRGDPGIAGREHLQEGQGPDPRPYRGERAQLRTGRRARVGDHARRRVRGEGPRIHEAHDRGHGLLVRGCASCSARRRSSASGSTASTPRSSSGRRARISTPSSSSSMSTRAGSAARIPRHPRFRELPHPQGGGPGPAGLRDRGRPCYAIRPEAAAMCQATSPLFPSPAAASPLLSSRFRL